MIVSRNRGTKRRGLSLLEVLVALAIFLMSIVAIAGLVDFGSEQGKAASMQAIGTRLAQSKLAEVEAGAVALDSTSQGTFDDEPDWNFTVDPGSPTIPNLYPVQVRVYREVSGRKHEVILAQMIYDPFMMGTGATAQPPAVAGSTTTTGSSP